MRCPRNDGKHALGRLARSTSLKGLEAIFIASQKLLDIEANTQLPRQRAHAHTSENNYVRHVRNIDRTRTATKRTQTQTHTGTHACTLQLVAEALEAVKNV